MKPVRFILVGGFLGAGKTTLLAQAARRLAKRGLRVGLITNDQAVQLVDTHNLQSQGLAVGEVAGGCFCCRFDDLLKSARQLIQKHRPDILLGEPVGSCTDLSATVMQPLKQFCSTEFVLSPFTVLADIRRAADYLSGQATHTFPPSVVYIYQKQLDEADLVLLNKSDLLPPNQAEAVRDELARRLGGADVRCISARDGAGIDAWLDTILGQHPAGQRIVPVDYQVYADGEAELGWLNAGITLQADNGADWAGLSLGLMDELRSSMAGKKAEIAHLKLFMQATGEAHVGRYIVASITRNADKPLIASDGILANDVKNAELTVNARVHISPEALRSALENALTKIFTDKARWQLGQIDTFRPSPPTPTHRFAEVVTGK